VVPEFTYLGSCLCDDGEVTNEVTCRIEKASRVFGSLDEAILVNRTFSVLLYGMYARQLCYLFYFMVQKLRQSRFPKINCFP